MLPFLTFCDCYDYLNELNEIRNSKQGHPTWVKALVVWFGLQASNLEQQIAKEEDPQKRDELLARQNRLLAYMTGLGIAVDTKDRGLMTRLRSRARR
jgi:hypothetical protein